MLTATPASREHAFEARVAEVKAPKSDMNALILDYLMFEGYSETAANFSKEANLQPARRDPTIRARQAITISIYLGNIETAITDLNEIDPQILDEDPALHFYLLRLQLVELIRKCNGGDITPALEFATTKLAPRAAMNSEWLKELEKTMALLIFPHNSLAPELAALLNPDLRLKTSRQVQEALMMRRTKRREAAIRELIKMRAWAEETARANKLDLPDRIELLQDHDFAKFYEGLITIPTIR
ncbi:CTLH/CRA C-terminal to lish motif domain-containing protein [Bombardia bombarda]|uniref:CTLH/CRA C-terminal to lish motif domain-containing protein n=1 Tax=Bombardia bombarda TaxID=252184 RepID=A0AA39XN64_9PEZI|nr:CTLH/CRA C-terminal to lish motif domain-containing protein [Bombardia bombarda]